MSSSSVASYFSSLATSEPVAPNGPNAGDAGSSAGSATGDSDAGASGDSHGGVTLSNGAMAAIIVVVVVVCVFGIVSSVLFYLAKKRSWEVRKTIRKSARRVATALTPRRTTFPKDIQKRPSGRGLTRIDEVPTTPKRRGTDVEKDGGRMMEFELSEPSKHSKWARKLGK